MFRRKGAIKKYRAEWTGLKTPYVGECRGGHSLWAASSENRVQKRSKNGSQPQPAAAGLGPVVSASNDNGELELYLSSAEDAASDSETEANPDGKSLKVGGNEWHISQALDVVNPQVGVGFNIGKPSIMFSLRVSALAGCSALHFVDLFLPDDHFPRLLVYKFRIADEKDRVAIKDMRHFVSTMFTMTVTPMCNIKHYWRASDNGLLLAAKFHYKLRVFTNASNSYGTTLVWRLPLKVGRLSMLLDHFRQCSMKEWQRSTSAELELWSTSGGESGRAKRRAGS